jgi:UPF0755 protein
MKFSIFNFQFSNLKQRFESHPRIVAIRDRVRTRFHVRVDTTPVHTHFFSIIYYLFAVILLWSIAYGFFWRAPGDFPEAALVSIERGETLSQVAHSFEEQKVVRSSFWMKLFVRLTGGERRVIAGDYYFPEPVNIFSVIKQIHKGQFGLVPIRVTVQEGLSSYDIAAILDKDLPVFDAGDFLEEVDDNNYEGTLFPDTYFFLPNTKASAVILTMRENFARQISTYKEDIEKSGRPLDELVIMASIIEGESSHNLDDKRVVSGILWNRLRLKMPMQVDAPFRYYNGKHSYTLTKVDLGEDHPYNTYVNKGLPPTAINNPGIDSLRAAIAPTNSKYLYFMSDKSGNMYYAVDFAGHQNNRELYLR